jgi:hypothetical protein
MKGNSEEGRGKRKKDKEEGRREVRLVIGHRERKMRGKRGEGRGKVRGQRRRRVRGKVRGTVRGKRGEGRVKSEEDGWNTEEE